MTLRLAGDSHRALALEALFTGRSVNEIVTGLIEAHLASPEHCEVVDRGVHDAMCHGDPQRFERLSALSREQSRKERGQSRQETS